jgi:hypothetical protein
MGRVIIVITLALTTFVSAGGQSQRSRGKSVRPAGKLLVTKLPDGVEGVTLIKGRIRLKPGYKFVRQEDGTVTVARIRGGASSVSGTFKCQCAGGGDCELSIGVGNMFCKTGTCKGSCSLFITISGGTVGLIQY